MREFVRPGGVPTERVELNTIVRGAARLIESEAQRHDITVHLRLAASLPPIRGDRIHVEQVLLNLSARRRAQIRRDRRRSPERGYAVRTPAPVDDRRGDS